MSGPVIWIDVASENGGQPAWLWRAWTEDTTADDYVDAEVGYGMAPTPRGPQWVVQVWIGHEMRRSNPCRDERDARERGEALVQAFRGLWEAAP
jgi:hypothetical protein